MCHSIPCQSFLQTWLINLKKKIWNNFRQIFCTKYSTQADDILYISWIEYPYLYHHFFYYYIAIKSKKLSQTFIVRNCCLKLSDNKVLDLKCSFYILHEINVLCLVWILRFHKGKNIRGKKKVVQQLALFVLVLIFSYVY